MMAHRSLIGGLLLILVGSACPYTAFAQRAPDPMGDLRGYVDGELPLTPVRSRPRELGDAQDRPLVSKLRPDRAGDLSYTPGGLSGKTVYLSPGHGWVYSESWGWGTQRGNSFGLVEDLSNIDGVSQFLVSYLRRAGAQVVPVREIDPTPRWVILDNSDGAGDPTRGTYAESGDSSRFFDSGLGAWGHPQQPLSGSVTPFSLGQDRLMLTSTSETARVTFVPHVPRSGRYNLYVSYTMGETRASDAELIVTHPGGKTRYLVDQRRHGGTWVLVDRLTFEEGTSWSRGAVAWTNRSQDPGATVSVDAIRLGGGTGVVDRGGGTSGQPRADECARYHLQLAGAPVDVFNPSTGSDHTDDDASRARFADWLHAPGEPAVYLSCHSNALDGSLRGTETYVYGTNAPDGSYQPTAETVALGSDRLGRAIHEQIVGDLRDAYQGDWEDRGLKSAYFGELSTANQDEMAAALVEVAFHDNEQDAAALKDPAWRRLVARAMYKGVLKYFTQADGSPVVLLPETPRQVAAINRGAGRVLVSWSPPESGGVLGDPAESYRVYRSVDGVDFDEGTDTGGQLSYEILDASAGELLYLRVSATNAGGESLPCATLAVGAGGGQRASVLLVDGFDRLDAGMTIKEHPPGLGEVERLYLARMNSGSYLVENGQALGRTGFAFDACIHDALGGGGVDASNYAAVVWAGGQGLQGRRGLTPALREALTRAARAGVALLISSAVMARWMDGDGAAVEDRAFIREIMATGYAGPAQPFSEVASTTAPPLFGLEPWTIHDGEGGGYDGRDADALEPATTTPLASYLPGGASAVTLNPAGPGCAVYMGFPLETVRPAARRGELMERLMGACEVQELPEPEAGVAAHDAASDSVRPDSDGGPDLSVEGAAPPAGCSCDAAAGGGPGQRWLIGLLCLVGWRRLRARARGPAAPPR